MKHRRFKMTTGRIAQTRFFENTNRSTFPTVKDSIKQRTVSVIAPERVFVRSLPIGRKDDGHSLLGFTRCDLRRITRRRAKRSQGSTMANYLAESQTGRPHLATKNVLIHRDNVPVHTSAVGRIALTNCRRILQSWPLCDCCVCFRT